MQLHCETSRLILRELELSDFEDIHEYAQNGEVMQFQKWGPNTKAETIKYLQEALIQIHHQPRLQYNFAIQMKKTKKVIGSCGLFRKENDLQSVKIGYILNPLYWRKGLGTEAVKEMISYIRSDLGIIHISATCDTRNIASRELLEKLGFELIETIVNDYAQKGHWRDTLVYQF